MTSPLPGAFAFPEALLARFRSVAFERLERIDAAWSGLCRGTAPPGADEDLFRELHTVKGDARVVGFADVAVLCQRLEDVVAAARQRRYRVHEDVDIVVTMAIQFVGMLLRKKGNARGIDLVGFLAQIDQVLSEWLTDASDPPPAGACSRPNLRVEAPHRASCAARGRLSCVATDIYLEHLRASGRPSARLRSAWEVLSSEIAELEARAVEPLLEGHAAAGRELARDLGKSVDVVVEGAEVRATVEAFEALGTVILHGIRNAIDHGVEPAIARERAGKPATATVRVVLRQSGDTIEADVCDDGAGIDFEAVREKARRLGVTPGPALVEMLFLPGFSTRESVTDISGRGVGLDAVRSIVERLGGRVTLESAPGRGTRLRAAVPNRSATVDVLVFRAPGRSIAFAVDAEWAVDGSAGARQEPYDLLAALDIPRRCLDTDARVLGLTRGDASCRIAVDGPPWRGSALRLCPTPVDAPIEIVQLADEEAVLVRPDRLEAVCLSDPTTRH